MTSQIFISPALISAGLLPKAIAEICAKNPTKRIVIRIKAVTTTKGCPVMPAEKIMNFVKKIPKGGMPEIAKNPAKKSKPVTGKASSTPTTLTILVELYLRKIVPAVRKRADFAKAL